MSILTMPDIVPSLADYALVSQAQVFQSELSGAMQTAALPIDLWTANLTFSNKSAADAGRLRAFLTSLRGQAGRFWCPMYDHPTPIGTALGPGAVSGAGQTGSTLVTDGWDAGQDALLLPGDYIQIGAEVKVITAVAASDSGGVATLTFSPPLRVSPADNAPIVTAGPAFVAMLKDGSQSKSQIQPGRIYAFSLAVVEALDL